MSAGGCVQFHDHLDHAPSAMDFQAAKEMSLKKSPLRREYSLTDMLGEGEVKDKKQETRETTIGKPPSPIESYQCRCMDAKGGGVKKIILHLEQFRNLNLIRGGGSSAHFLQCKSSPRGPPTSNPLHIHVSLNYFHGDARIFPPTCIP